MCMGVLPTWKSVHMCAVPAGLKRVSDSLELEWQGSCELYIDAQLASQSSVRAAGARNHWVIPPALVRIFLTLVTYSQKITEELTHQTQSFFFFI